MESSPRPTAPADCYRFADLVIDTRARRVTRDGAELAIAGLSFDLLVELVRAAPGLVSVDALMTSVWKEIIVSPETITQRVKLLRQALGDTADNPRYIAGRRGYGYRLVTPVLAISEASRTGEPKPRPRRGRWYLSAALGLVALAAAILGYNRWHRDVAGLPVQAAAQRKSPSVIEPRTTVAVLPFVNLTGDPNKDYLGDGMAEEVINMLARVPGLKVPARTSSFAYKGRNVDVRSIAADLGVGTVLEGSVREAGARIRITAELISAQDGLHLWSQSYDRSYTDLFQLQDDLASQIVQALKVNIGGPSTAAIVPPSRTGNVEAYDLYLQGEAVLDRPSPLTFQRAVTYLQAAVTRDPTLAPAFARMGTALVLSGEIGEQPIEKVAAAERAANQAIALDPTLAESEEVLSNVSRVRGRWLEARTHSRSAILLSPGDANAHLVAGYLLAEVGQLRASLAEFDQAYALAPANLAVINLRSYSQSLIGHEADALKSARLAEDLGLPHANFSPVYEQAALRTGHYADATSAALDYLDATHPDEAHTREIVTLVYGALADPSRKAAALSAGARLYPANRGRGIGSARIAKATACLQSSYAFALLGELDVAYDMANRCLDAMAPGAVSSRVQRLWTAGMQPFRRDPRFQAFASRLGLMQYWRQYAPPDECGWEAGQLICH
ncbi:MAG: winged helix-turn-helix domain-containing protein [Steroidobacteraceae bacterium]